MRSYRDLLKEKFPQDEKNGLYVFPKLPAVKLGKLLLKERQIASPNDVVALHTFSSMFSSGHLILTPKTVLTIPVVRSLWKKSKKCKTKAVM